MQFDFDSSLPWGKKLPAKGYRYIPLLTPKQGQKLHLIALSDSLETIGTHFVDSRTVPCFGTSEKCQACQRGFSPRYFAYLGVSVLPGGRLAILSLTANAVRTCPVIDAPDGHLRGAYIVAEREGSGPRGKMSVTVAFRKPATDLPEPFNVREVLLSIWGLRLNPGKG